MDPYACFSVLNVSLVVSKRPVARLDEHHALSLGRGGSRFESGRGGLLGCLRGVNYFSSVTPMQKIIHPRLINQLFENPQFTVGDDSLPMIARDIINMNWWNTCGWLTGYSKNKRVHRDCPEILKLIAVQLKEYYREDKIARKNETEFRSEIRGFVSGESKAIPQLGYQSMRARANPSQYFVDEKTGLMTWVDCTSRSNYAAKYVAQNGYIDFDGKCRVIDGGLIADAVSFGTCHDIGVSDYFISGDNLVKKEVFSQKENQLSVLEWVELLSVTPIKSRTWLLKEIGKIKTDPYKLFELKMVKLGVADGLNECFYGFKTSQSKDFDASRASHASAASRASAASHASAASDAGTTAFDGSAWAECKNAIKKPDGLKYPDVFRKNIFAIAGSWKINTDLVKNSRLGWFDPFMGHGSSPITAKKLGKKYHGFDTNAAAFGGHLKIIKTELESIPGASVKMELFDSAIFRPDLVNQFDLCYTSPPYFDFEEYGGNTAHFDRCKDYPQFMANVIMPVLKNAMEYLIAGGILALQVGKDKTHKKLWCDVITQCGFTIVQTTTQGKISAYAVQAKRDQNLIVAVKPDFGID